MSRYFLTSSSIERFLETYTFSSASFSFLADSGLGLYKSKYPSDITSSSYFGGGFSTFSLKSIASRSKSGSSSTTTLGWIFLDYFGFWLPSP